MSEQPDVRGRRAAFLNHLIVEHTLNRRTMGALQLIIKRIVLIRGVDTYGQDDENCSYDGYWEDGF